MIGTGRRAVITSRNKGIWVIKVACTHYTGKVNVACAHYTGKVKVACTHCTGKVKIACTHCTGKVLYLSLIHI